jgi:hypothetical protein
MCNKISLKLLITLSGGTAGLKAVLNISDRTLFPAFQAFWQEMAPEAQHPALLGQFRVALAEQGYPDNLS